MTPNFMHLLIEICKLLKMKVILKKKTCKWLIFHKQEVVFDFINISMFNYINNLTKDDFFQ